MRDRLVPPTWFNIFLVLPVGLHFVLPIRRVIRPPVTYPGALLIVLGVILNIRSLGALRRNRTTTDFHRMPNRLVTEGPFRISRNPAYLSGVVVSLGIAMLLGSLITFVFPVALLLILDRLYIPSEEETLEKLFGDEYLEYKRGTRRWA